MICDASRILNALQEAAAESHDRDVLGQRVVTAVQEAFPQASWVGIYWMSAGVLHLGPYVGPATEHVRIPVGLGVCGTAIELDEDQRVDDVREVENYLACAPGVRSEIVVLIRAQGEVVGQLDLDSEQVAAFDENAHCVLRAVADGFGGLLEVAP